MITGGAFALLIGIAGVWAGFRGLRNHAILNRWPMTKGRVVERGVYKPKIPSTYPPALRYAPLVKYVYQVGGKEFTNNCIHPKRIHAPIIGIEKWARERAASFPDEVTVHYNPEDPSESFLIQASKKWLYVGIVGFCLMILFVSSFFILPGVLSLLTK